MQSITDSLNRIHACLEDGKTPPLELVKSMRLEIKKLHNLVVSNNPGLANQLNHTASDISTPEGVRGLSATVKEVIWYLESKKSQL
jgi:hypothetical protein